MITEKVKLYIENEHLFTPQDKILVALSGGADSVALLRLLLHTGYRCEAAHCNFHLRGDESDRDETFVRQLCCRLQVPLHVTHFHTTQVAAQRHISIEMAARELRYEWFESTRLDCGAAVIAVAHHSDDSVETFLLNLIRGTGINGLRGIRARNGRIVRPLLCLSRRDITDYLQSIGQDYVTDSTNLHDEYTRNKIRLNIVPLLQQINPSVKDSILQTARHLDDAYHIYIKGIEEGRKRVFRDNRISIPLLLQEPSPATLLFELVAPLGFNHAQIDDLLASLSTQSGKTFLSSQWKIVKDRDCLLIENREETPVRPLLQTEVLDYTPGTDIPRSKDTACLDADKIKHPLSLRLWKQGDTFVPFGMKGKKKISDYLTDRKFSLPRKQRQWVLCCGDDIVWLVGERSDNRYRIDEHTRKMLVIKVVTG